MRVAVPAAGLLATIAIAAPPPVVSWQDAPAHVGDIVTVEGDVVSATSSGDTVTLEFAREPGAFRVVLLVPMMNDLPPHPERLWDGKRVRASGRIEKFRGRAEMVLRSPSQIEVVDLAAVASATPPTTPPVHMPAPPPQPTPPAAVAPSPPPVAPPPAPTERTATPSTTPAAVVPPPSPTVAAAPAPPPTIAAAPPPTSPPPAPAPPRDLAEAVQRRVGALDGCERARARWRDASNAARAGAETLTRCLDGGTYDCRTAAAALAPALSSLEGAAQQVERACPP